MPDSSWIGSLDVHQWALTQMNRELKNHSDASQRILSPLKDQDGLLNSQLKMYGQLQSLLAAFQTSVTAVTSAFNPSYQITSSNTSVASAVVNGTAVAGSHTLHVNQMAQSGSIASATTFTSQSESANVSETLNISVGSANFDITIKANDSLQTIANNINIGAKAQNTGVQAYVINTSANSYQLVIASTQTGVANAVSVNESNISGGTALNITTPSGGGAGGSGTVLTTAQDSKFVFDNISYQQSSNSNILIGGFNVTLAGEGDTTIVAAATNSIDSATTAIQNMISAYNQIDTLIEQTQATSNAPDITLSLVLQQLQGVINGSVGSGDMQNLRSIGIGSASPTPITVIDANGDPIEYTIMGQLQINPIKPPATATQLNTALTSNFSQVQELLSGTSGIMTSVGKMLMPSSGSVSKAMSNFNMTLNKELTAVEESIDDENFRMEKLKKDLIYKYANLELSLSKLQVTSQMISANTSQSRS